MSVWANIMHGRTEIPYSFGEDAGKDGSIYKRVEFRCWKAFSLLYIHFCPHGGLKMSVFC